MSRWVDINPTAVDITRPLYLVELFYTSRGTSRLALRSRPAYTNRSREPRLYGWCGETDNISVWAEGMVRVSRVNAAGDKALIRKLKGAELRAALEADGYPELEVAS